MNKFLTNCGEAVRRCYLPKLKEPENKEIGLNCASFSAKEIPTEGNFRFSHLSCQ
jgi:hypothetical protein